MRFSDFEDSALSESTKLKKNIDMTGTDLENVLSEKQKSVTSGLNPLKNVVSAPIKQTPVIEQPKTDLNIPESSPKVVDSTLYAQAISDVKEGMPIESLSEYYPEIADKAEIFKQLKTDLDAGMPETEISRLYPELSGQTTQPTEQITEPITETPKEDQGFFGGLIQKTGEAAKKSAELIGKTQEQFKQGDLNFGEAAVRGASGALGVLTSPIAGVVGQTVEEGVGMISDENKKKVADKIAPLAKKIGEVYAALPEEQKKELANIGYASDVLLNIAGGQALKGTGKKLITETTEQAKTLPKIGANIRGALQRVSEGDKAVKFDVDTGTVTNVLGKTAKAAEETPKEARVLVRKAFRPSVAGVDTAKKFDQVEDKLIDGVKEVAKRTGKIEDGRDVLLKADQVKKEIWKELQDQTALAGTKVDVNPSTVINKIVEFKNTLKNEFISNPNLEKKIDEQIQLWLEKSKSGNIDLPSMEEIKTGYNKNIGNYLTAKDKTDSLINAKISEILGDISDDAIESALGTTNTNLRNTYGAVRQLEKETARRFGVFERANEKGLSDMLADMPSAGALAYSALSGDVRGAVVAGGFQLGKFLTKRANDPNRQLRELFNMFTPGKYDKSVSFKIKEPKVVSVKPIGVKKQQQKLLPAPKKGVKGTGPIRTSKDDAIIAESKRDIRNAKIGSKNQ